MYDSVDASTIPAGAGMVAGYVDLNYKWPASGWARFPHAVKVRIAASPFTDDGHVYDFEPGNDMAPAHLVNWIGMRRRAGVDPCVYMDQSHWPLVRQICSNAGIAQPLYWVAHWGVAPVVPAGAVALQYRSTPGWDESVVLDHWPSVDSAPAPPPPPPPPGPPPPPPFTGVADMIMYAVAATDTTAAPGSDANPGIWLMSGDLYVHMLNVTTVGAMLAAGVPQVPCDNAQHLAFKAAAGHTTTAPAH